jgi:hypothetical protein
MPYWAFFPFPAFSGSAVAPRPKSDAWVLVTRPVKRRQRIQAVYGNIRTFGPRELAVSGKELPRRASGIQNVRAFPRPGGEEAEKKMQGNTKRGNLPVLPSEERSRNGAKNFGTHRTRNNMQCWRQNWGQFAEYLKNFPLPTPRIVHSYAK